jgi:hypothetical protein
LVPRVGLLGDALALWEIFRSFGLTSKGTMGKWFALPHASL